MDAKYWDAHIYAGLITVEPNITVERAVRLQIGVHEALGCRYHDDALEFVLARIPGFALARDHLDDLVRLSRQREAKCVAKVAA
jgi:hypothetical protein